MLCITVFQGWLGSCLPMIFAYSRRHCGSRKFPSILHKGAEDHRLRRICTENVSCSVTLCSVIVSMHCHRLAASSRSHARCWCSEPETLIQHTTAGFFFSYLIHPPMNRVCMWFWQCMSNMTAALSQSSLLICFKLILRWLLERQCQITQLETCMRVMLWRMYQPQWLSCDREYDIVVAQTQWQLKVLGNCYNAGLYI